MNKLLYTFIFTVILLSSCKTEVTDRHYYYKCFFLGETGFLIDGEAFHRPPYNGSSIYAEPLAESVPFDSLVARISRKSGTSDYYTGWEIPAIKLSESKFQLPVDITSNGITIDKDIITSSTFINALKYTNNASSSSYFLAFELKFYFNDRFEYVSNFPVFQEGENNEYRLFAYTYIYVAEPVDASWTYTKEPFSLGDIREIHHYDFNFSKPGWYKIIERYYREIGDDPTGENTYFIPPEREASSQ